MTGIKYAGHDRCFVEATADCFDHIVIDKPDVTTVVYRMNEDHGFAI